MSKKWLFVGLLIGSTAYLASKGYGYYKQLQYRVDGVKLTQVTSNTLQLSIDLSFYNPTPVTLTVQNIKGDVYLNSKRVGYIKTTMGQVLSSKTLSKVSVPVILDSYATSGNILGNLIKGKELTDSVLQAKTIINVANIPVKVNFEYKISDLL